jgi:hypothetical protein
MNEFVRYNSAENGNIVHSIVYQILQKTGMALPAKVVNNVAGGLLISMDNQSALYHARQISISKTAKDFEEVMRVVIKLRDPRAGASYSFCRRIDGMIDVNYVTQFKYNAMSLYYQDQNQFLDRFSGIENQIVNDFFSKFSSHTFNK